MRRRSKANARAGRPARQVQGLAWHRPMPAIAGPSAFPRNVLESANFRYDRIVRVYGRPLRSAGVDDQFHQFTCVSA
jgi:hypothetical protein